MHVYIGLCLKEGFVLQTPDKEPVFCAGHACVRMPAAPQGRNTKQRLKA